MGALLVLIGRIGLMALIYLEYGHLDIEKKFATKIIDINDFPQDQVCYKFLGHIATCVYCSILPIILELDEFVWVDSRQHQQIYPQWHGLCY